MSGEDARIARGLNGRRSGRGWMARCPVHKDETPSLTITERCGKVLVHCHAGCTQHDVIEALRARGLWPEREQHTSPLSRQDAMRQLHRERDLPIADLWRRTAVAMADEVLAAMKDKLYTGTIDPQELRNIEAHAARWRILRGPALVEAYRAFLRANPRLTSGMVKAAWRRRQLEEQVLWRVLMEETA
jgi:hypothetical protein